MSFGIAEEEIADRLGMHLVSVQRIIQELKTGRRRDRRKVAGPEGSAAA